MERSVAINTLVDHVESMQGISDATRIVALAALDDLSAASTEGHITHGELGARFAEFFADFPDKSTPFHDEIYMVSRSMRPLVITK